MKYILSYASPKRINKKYIIIEADSFQKISEIKPDKIDHYYFSSYENLFENFYPSTNNKSNNEYNYEGF